MGLYDRDWYREELRKREQTQPRPLDSQPFVIHQSPRRGPPGLLNAGSIIVILFSLVAALVTAIVLK